MPVLFFIYIFILICVCGNVFALLYVILIFLLSNKIRPNEQCIVSNQNKRLKRELIFLFIRIFTETKKMSAFADTNLYMKLKILPENQQDLNFGVDSGIRIHGLQSHNLAL